MTWRGEVEDGTGWGGLVPTKAEREAEKAAAADMTYRGRLQSLLFDLWRDEVLSEQQCAKYHGVDLVSMRRIFDCEAARRGLSSRDAPQAR